MCLCLVAHMPRCTGNLQESVLFLLCMRPMWLQALLLTESVLLPTLVLNVDDAHLTINYILTESEKPSPVSQIENSSDVFTQ